MSCLLIRGNTSEQLQMANFVSGGADALVVEEQRKGGAAQFEQR